MASELLSKTLLRRILFRSARIPALYLIMGIVLVALSYIDTFFPLVEFEHFFNITDKLGNIFIALAFITFGYNALIFLSLRSEQKLSENHKIASVILKSIRKSLRVIFLLITINVIINIAEPTKTSLIFANNVINTILICSIGWIAIQIFYTIEDIIYERMNSVEHTQHSRAKALYTKMHIIRNVATVVIIIITIAAILMSFSSVRNIGISLLASAGFLTAVIGLAAQRTLFSVFSGLQLAMSQALKIGDIVVIEKESGIVEEITFTYVTLKLGDRRRLIVPINYFSEKPFENWSRDYHSLRSSLHFHVDFLMPIAPLRDELNRILQFSAYWDGQAQKLQVSNLTDRTVEVRIQVSASNADNLSDLRAEVREKILEFIRTYYPDYFPKVRFNQSALQGE